MLLHFQTSQKKMDYKLLVSIKNTVVLNANGRFP